MLIGTPKEIKTHEYRVGLTPGGVKELVKNNHQVIIETKAGEGIGFSDEDYIVAGATIVQTAAEIFSKAEMIVKVKEPQPQECSQLKEGQILFTYLHLAADKEQTLALMKSKCTAIAYETVTDVQGGLPLLAPMSEVAGRLSIQAGAYAMQKHQGGNGILLGGVPGVAPANVMILGGGVVGYNAAKIAVGMGANVSILDKSIPRLNQLDSLFNGRINTIFSTLDNVEQYSKNADLIIGAVLVPGASAPRLITKEMLKNLKKGTVLVDVAIDQGGCFETSKATTHKEPTYVVDDIIHYCVANMPGAVAKTSTLALTNATLPFVLALANKGVRSALAQNVHLAAGLNIYNGEIVYEAVAASLNLPLGEI